MEELRGVAPSTVTAAEVSETQPHLSVDHKITQILAYYLSPATNAGKPVPLQHNRIKIEATWGNKVFNIFRRIFGKPTQETIFQDTQKILGRESTFEKRGVVFTSPTGEKTYHVEGKAALDKNQADAILDEYNPKVKS